MHFIIDFNIINKINEINQYSIISKAITNQGSNTSP